MAITDVLTRALSWWNNTFFFTKFGRFSLISSLKRCNKIAQYRRWCFFLFEDNQWKLPHAHPKKTDAITFPVDKVVFAFFGPDSPLTIHCFDCSFVSGVKWWTHVDPWRKNSALFLRNIAKQFIETFSRPCFWSIVSKRGTAFSCPNFYSICDVQHFLICLPYQLTRALSIDGRPIWFCGLYNYFYLIWSTTVGFILTARTASFKLCNPIFHSCKSGSRLP